MLTPQSIRWLPIFPRAKAKLLAAHQDAQYRRAVSQAREAKDWDRVQQLEQERRWEQQDEFEWTEIQFTRRLVARGRKLRVPIPARPHGDEDSEHWSLSRSNGEWYLTTAGVTVLRDGIRTEEKWRREQRAHYLSWITALTGLVGTITGLLAVIWKLRSG